MSFWVTAYCHKTVADVGPKDLLVGITNRLDVLVALFPGDRPEEESPEAIRDVLSRLEFVPYEDKARPFRIDRFCDRENGPPIGLYHMCERHNVQGVIEQEVLPGKLAGMRRPEAARVRELLAGATEKVSFSLKGVHYTGIGFPLTIAAAATLITHAGGIIRSGSSSWMVPAGREVDIILEYDG